MGEEKLREQMIRIKNEEGAINVFYTPKKDNKRISPMNL